MKPADHEARALALDPLRSFIVQAPAGSGKTELLIQRYLRLLARVDEPEQILAITFTRKAAAEMRTRVLAALEAAQQPDEAASAHRRQTLELARAALAADAQRQWHLRRDPQRMRIGTLDSFNSSLAAHLPLLSGGAGGSGIAEDASACYAEAARRTVEMIWQDAEASRARAAVLAELDFDAATAERLIAALLAVREQWIGWLLDVDSTLEATRAGLRALQRLAQAQVGSLVDAQTAAEMLAMAQHAAVHGAPGTRDATAGAHSTDRFEQLSAIAQLFLTARGQWRRRFTKAEGFGAGFPEQKARVDALHRTLSGNAELEAALARIKTLPATQLSERDSDYLAAVADVLRHAVAQLRVIFARGRVVDFSELSLAARLALGQTDAPSELLLALDQRIAHILVDEFQDTSVAQNELLEALTEGWEPNDGRTLFLVGDPMQSIYRFRNADMSLFIAARRFGIGNVLCEPLRLTVNFRSAPAVVDWVNAAFSACFPAEDDLAEGVAGFTGGIAAAEPNGAAYVHAHALGTEDLASEHAAVVELIAAERAEHPDSSIAILVRSRAHLAGFQSLLREHGWHARAVEIDAPFTAQLTQDLIGLARALTHFADRLAWLALLRAPWCGLRWSELEALIGDDAGVTVWEAVHDRDRLARLEDASRVRVERVREILSHALARRASVPFVEWLEETFEALDGPATVPPGEQAQLADLFALFQQAAADQDIEDVAELETFFRKPLRQPDTQHAGIDIMTIHRAQGLEFDCVILPGLARRPRGDDRRLVEWFDAFDDEGRRMRIAAAPRRRGSELTEWIRARNRDRSAAETARLLYVAATRARQRLHLVWGLAPDAAPVRTTLLHPVWSLLEAAPLHAPEPQRDEPDGALIVPLRRLRALPPAPLSATPPGAAAQAPLIAAADVSYPWTSGTAASIGIVVHEWLQTMCDNPQLPWKSRIDSLRDTFVTQLELLGVPDGELTAARTHVVNALHGVLDDDNGRWIVGERESAESEVMLSEIIDGQVVHQRLDRTFVDAGVRWIIDYKTAMHHEGDVEAFLQAEVDRYRPQLERYARFMARRDARPIRLGLYFPMLPVFRQWPAAGSQAAFER